MSWLRDHFHDFVFPAFVASTPGEIVSTEKIGAPFDVKASASAPEHFPTELKKLWTLCKEYNVTWSDSPKEFGGFGTSFARKSSKIHGTILRNTLQSAVVSMKAEKCSKLLLAGRDVWILAVIAEKRSVPYEFIPQISRMACADKNILSKFLKERGIVGDELLVDTGFMGSIAVAISAALELPMKFRLMSQNAKIYSWSYASTAPGDMPVEVMKDKRIIFPNMLFPNRKKARSEALETEYLAKYWRTGTIRDGRIVQALSLREDIQRAARLTSNVWRGLE